MLIEHKSQGDPYDSRHTWLIRDSKSEFVAVAAWRELVDASTGFGGGARRLQTVKVDCAESDSLSELQQWAQVQKAKGAEYVNLHRTWQIEQGLPYAGLRDNAFIERI